MSDLTIPEFHYSPSDRSHLERTERGTSGPQRTIGPTDVRLSVLPVGQVDTTFTVKNTFVDINVAAAPTDIAINSNKRSSSVVPASSFGFIPRGTELSIWSDNQAPCVLLEIGDTALLNWAEGMDIDPVRLQDFRHYEVDQAIGSFGHMATSLLSSLETTNNPADVMTMEAIVLGVSARLLRRVALDTPQARPNIQLVGSRTDYRLVRSLEFAMTHLGNSDLKVSDLAAEAGMSVHHYAEVFKQWKGMSPYAFIRLERLKAAEHLLSATNTPIATIAYETGFSSQAHFTTAFKSVYGMTPGKLRA